MTRRSDIRFLALLVGAVLLVAPAVRAGDVDILPERRGFVMQLIPGGRTRTIGDPAERWRKAVANRIWRTLERIRGGHHPPDRSAHSGDAPRAGAEPPQCRPYRDAVLLHARPAGAVVRRVHPVASLQPL